MTTNMSSITIALLTLRHGVRQPVTWLAIAAGAVLLLLSAVFGLFTFYDADRIRLLGVAGIAVHVLIGIFLAVSLTASAIRDELTSHSAATLFANQLDEGVTSLANGLAAAIALFAGLVLTLAHLGLLGLVTNFGFDVLAPAASNAQLEAIDERDRISLGPIVSNHGLTMLHSICMAALTTLLATRLPLIPCLITGLGMFVVAHLLGSIGVPGVVVIPALDLFRADDLIQFDDTNPSVAYFALCVLRYAVRCWLLVGRIFFGLAAKIFTEATSTGRLLVRYAIFGDIHGNFDALSTILADIESQGAEKLICLGDIVGYGAEPMRCPEAVRELGCDVIAGNHDWPPLNAFRSISSMPTPRQRRSGPAKCCLQTKRTILANCH